ncbi:hypothetical protein IVA80_15360 [Bradyrhizobium sp. 139]|uniref:hypothetical protein n=1 Tax=Bradyrhizobium sp. 139 TaxID=2782616 RepID=UPI001FF92ACD|nr:hypothetical protein [Bradyrhizobium sp. 139]MCK1742202.1 hypothetical protein [Bradyrhizobium sp. 139]
MIDYVSRKLAGIVLDDGRLARFTDYYDTNGDECGPEPAVTAIAEHPDGTGWITVVLRDWPEPVRH